jgi:acyl-CoA synthetase (AMP-forming)/AMP-acid ligase II
MIRDLGGSQVHAPARSTRFPSYLPDFRVADLVRVHAREDGEHAALTCGERTLTYAELDARSNRVGQALLGCGLQPGDRVAVLDKNSAEVVEVLLGAAKAALVTVPLNWRLSGAELASVLRDAAARVLVVHDDFMDLLPEALDGLPESASIVRIHGPSGAQDVGGRDIVGYEQWTAAHEPIDPGHVGGPDEEFLQLYTSGTTGVPKGVLGTNRNLAATSSVTELWGIDAESVMLIAAPLFHIGGLSLVVITLRHGGRMLMVRDSVPEKLLDIMERERVTNTFLVPSVIGSLIDVPHAADRDWSALRAITYGASPITPALLRRALKTFRRPLFQVYGLTETHGAITQLVADDHDPGGPREHLLRTAGKPYDWVELRTVDVETKQQTPPGVMGELWVRSPGVTPGYFNRPEETAASIDNDGWLHTGDVASIDEHGYLTIRDRVKDMIITGGENVYAVEVEAVLADHPAVSAVAVIAVPDERWGEAVRAVVVLTEGEGADADELRSFARERLAGYKVPKAVDFVDTLPTGPTGKVLKRELRASYWDAVG